MIWVIIHSVVSTFKSQCCIHRFEVMIPSNVIMPDIFLPRGHSSAFERIIPSTYEHTIVTETIATWCIHDTTNDLSGRQGGVYWYPLMLHKSKWRYRQPTSMMDTFMRINIVVFTGRSWGSTDDVCLAHQPTGLVVELGRNLCPASWTGFLFESIINMEYDSCTYLAELWTTCHSANMMTASHMLGLRRSGDNETWQTQRAHRSRDSPWHHGIIQAISLRGF